MKSRRRATSVEVPGQRPSHNNPPRRFTSASIYVRDKPGEVVDRVPVVP